jgi:hypothetical protein
VNLHTRAGDLISTDSRNLTLVRPGDSEFLDAFDMNAAAATQPW